MAVPKELIDKVKKEMAEGSPEMADVEPTVDIKELSMASTTTKKLGIEKLEAKKVYTFTFKKTVTAEGGAKLPIVSRVTTDEDGNVIKKTGN
ncbi:Uncharacterised protein [uncultured archaeon]|nr:Uncharacterised protein [uncultured archaeon]